MDVITTHSDTCCGVSAGLMPEHHANHFHKRSVVVNETHLTDDSGSVTCQQQDVSRPIADRVVEQSSFNKESVYEREFVRCMQPKRGGVFMMIKLAKAYPELITKYPTSLLLTNGMGKTLAHCLFLDKKPDMSLLKMILATDEGRQSMNVPDESGKLPLHHGISLHRWPATEYLIKEMPELLLCRTGTSSSPLAALVCEYNVTCVDPCPILRDEKKTRAVLDLALSYPFVSEQLCTLDDFLDLQIDHDPELSARLTALRQQHAPPFKPVAFDVKEANAVSEPLLSQRHDETAGDLVVAGGSGVARQSHSQLIEALSLETSLDQTEVKARKIIRGLKKVGVYGRFTRFCKEEKGRYHSFGDENASLQLIRQLVRLDCPHITCRLSPPSDDTYGLAFDARKERLKQPWHLAKEQEDQEVVLHKLSYLLPEFDAEQGLPQTIRIGNSQVSFVRYDDPEPPCPLEIGFMGSKGRYRETGAVPENYMNIKPYRFGSESQMLCTDIHEGSRATLFPLNLPVNSLLPENDKKVAKGTAAAGLDITPRLFMDMSVSDEPLARNLALFSQATKNKALSSSVVYGLHHRYVSGKRIITKWIDALKTHAAASGRPVIIYVNQCGLQTPDVHQALSDTLVPMIKMISPEAETGLQKLLASGGVAVCELPSVPKPAFNFLLDSSNLPALVEGANTTSHLLETGHPYLSLLPDGCTAVPQEMGYSLEALKAEAFSYKLSLTPSEQKKLVELHSLLREEQYHDAVALLLRDNNLLSNLKFLFQQDHSDKRNGLRNITVLWLLEKGCKGRLGTLEKEALLAAVDPSDTALTDYIDAMGDKQSPTHDHFLMQQAHVGQPVNNALVAALNQFASIKKLNV